MSKKPYSALPMSPDTPFTHVKRNLTLCPMPMSTMTLLPHINRNLTQLCPCQQRLPFPMSRETSLCSANDKYRLFFPMSRETSLCSINVNRDSHSPYPCQKKPYSALPMSTEIPLTDVNRTLTLLCPCQQRLLLPMSMTHSFLPLSTTT
jgi:hypothetical protein